MEYAIIVTGFVAITTAIFGFTQYYYSRINDKDSKLSETIEANLAKLKIFQLNSVELQKTKRYQQLFERSEVSKKQLDESSYIIKRSVKKLILLVVLHALAPIYLIYLLLYGAIVYAEYTAASPTSTITHYILPYSLLFITATLLVVVTLVYFIVRSINSRQRKDKALLNNVSNDLDELAYDFGVFRVEFEKETQSGEQENQTSLEKDETFILVLEWMKNLSEEQMSILELVFNSNKKG